MFNRIFDSITSGFSRFVLSWAMPSALSVGIFAVFVFPAARNLPAFSAVRDAAAGNNPVTIAAILGFATAALAITFAYTSLPIYRLLEGYTLPGPVAKRFSKRQRRRWAELLRYAKHPTAANSRKRLEIDDRLLYPEHWRYVLPTRLGNALRALETYGRDRFGLDSQVFWHELVGCAPQRVKDQVDQTRGPVDLFISAVAHLMLLGIVSVGVGMLAPRAPDWQAIAVGGLALAAVPLAYGRAVRSVLDWRYATQALIHTGRVPLATQLGFQLPRHAEAERRLWVSLRRFVIDGQSRDWASLDELRTPPPASGPDDASSSLASSDLSS